MNIKQTMLGVLAPGIFLLLSGCASLHSQKYPEIIPAFVYVTIVGTNGKSVTIQAKVDTGATRSAAANHLVVSLDLEEVQGAKVYVKGGNGGDLRNRYYARIMYCGKVMDTIISSGDRRHLQYDMIIGREDLEGFLIDPSEPVKPDGGEFWFKTTELEENSELNLSLSCGKKN